MKSLSSTQQKLKNLYLDIALKQVSVCRTCLKFRLFLTRNMKILSETRCLRDKSEGKGKMFLYCVA